MLDSHHLISRRGLGFSSRRWMVEWDKGVEAGAIRRRCVKTLEYRRRS
jgi:hypothetical protein